MIDNRSNLCKILGVDYDEVFEFRGYRYKLKNQTTLKDSYDFLCEQYGKSSTFPCVGNHFVLVDMINHPDEIIHHKVFTPQEIEDAKVLARVLEVERIYRTDGGFLWGENVHGDEFPISDTMFLSISRNESYTYEQIIGGSE